MVVRWGAADGRQSEWPSFLRCIFALLRRRRQLRRSLTLSSSFANRLTRHRRRAARSLYSLLFISIFIYYYKCIWYVHLLYVCVRIANYTAGPGFFTINATETPVYVCVVNCTYSSGKRRSLASLSLHYVLSGRPSQTQRKYCIQKNMAFILCQTE